MIRPSFSLISYVLIFLLFVPFHPCLAQKIPFLTDDDIRMLSNELSGDRAFEHIRVLSQWHRDSGMEGFFNAADYVMQAAHEAGLENVHFIEQTLGHPNYTARSAELWMVEPVEVKLADMADHPVYLADGSHTADVTAELVWIGDAKDDSLTGLDVVGKIVLTNRSPGGAVQNAVWGKGALGVVSYQTSESRNPMDVPDQIAWSRIPLTPPEGKKGTFAFILPPRKGELLKKILQTDQMQDYFATGKRTKGGRIVLKAKVVTEIGKEPGRTGFVEGWIHGSKYHDQQIIITAHLQEEKSSANDDGSGCANILEIARTFNKLIKEGKMPRPLRDIRFWWTDEISSEYKYFQDFPDEPKKFLANIHQDMVGANQRMGSRVQHLIFAPHSRTSYLDAIFESIGNYLILTNNAFLAASRAGGYPRPFTRPLYSTRGTRDGYNARFVPYFNSSDHMCFVEGIIGVPAVATINWDDPYIHSSDDDLYQIDQTQLKRNAFLMGAMAYVLAFADEKTVPLLAGETFAQGEKRLANDLQAAIRVEEGFRKDSITIVSLNGGLKDARLLMEQGILREIRALNSIQVFTRKDREAVSMIEGFIARMQSKATGLMGDLELYQTEMLRNKLPEPQIDSSEIEASKRVPVNPSVLRTYFENRGKINFRGNLHGLMHDEVFNFVDGKRSYYDIYKGVRAEQLAAGSWYYGNVTLEDVVGLLNAAIEAKALTLK
ncbi:MAG: M28 family peptidase [Ignavibacteria bacterium]|nr:M28 family peptidase [Ignavibacteria bacterium]MBI3765579.1 M28 family peptidase [Ignavibacteriales bacterium]